MTTSSDIASNDMGEFKIASVGSSRTLGSAADGAAVAAHGDGLALLLDVLEELDSALELPAVDGLGGLAGVLEGHTQVGTAGAGRLGGNDLGGSVPNLFGAKKRARSAFCIVQNQSSRHRHLDFHLRPCCRPEHFSIGMSMYGSFISCSTFHIFPLRQQSQSVGGETSKSQIRDVLTILTD